MADSGVAVVAPMPSEQQQPMDQDKMAPVITDSKVLTHRITDSAHPASPSPMQSVDEHTKNHPNYTNTHNKDNLHKMEANETTSSATFVEKNKTVNEGISLIANGTNASGCSSGGDQELQVKPPTSKELNTTIVEQAAKKKKKIDETIIDGFAISAFKSWEELQDDMNERIASNLMKKRAAEKEAANDSSNEVAKKKSKIKSSSKTNSQSSTSGNSSSLLQQPKSDKVKKIKMDASKSKKKTSNGQSSKTADTRPSSKKHKAEERIKENANEGTSLGAQESAANEMSHSKRNFQDDIQRASDDKSNNDIPTRSVDKNRNDGPNTSQSPQVHHIHNHDQAVETPQSRKPLRQPEAPQRILTQDLLRDPHVSANPQTAQYSPYCNNPHLNHLYNVTSSIQHSMQTPPFNHHHHQPGSKSLSDQTKVPPQHSQSQQNNSKQNPPTLPPTQQSQSPHPSQQQAYQRGPAPPMHQNQGLPSAAGMNQSHPIYHHPMNMPGPNPYLYHQPHANMSQHQSPIPPHINPTTQFSPHNSYAQPPTPQNHQQYPGYLPHGAHHPPPMPTFGMYPSHMPHQQPQTSSMMTSMSMSQLPNPYGSPYIVNETTISRQTSIIPPPMPAALEQAAASAAASRFGHHSMLPPMNAYNPAAIVAPPQGNHNNPASLYQGVAPSAAISSTERSFMDLARSYNAAAAAASAPNGLMANYPSLMSSQAAYPPPTSTANPYSMDRWPTKMQFDHQRAVSRYNSLYQNSGGYQTRPPSFPASLFPPPF